MTRGSWITFLPGVIAARWLSAERICVEVNEYMDLLLRHACATIGAANGKMEHKRKDLAAFAGRSAFFIRDKKPIHELWDPLSFQRKLNHLQVLAYYSAHF